MKKLLISTIAIAAAISQASFAQTPTSDQLAQRNIERRAVEAVNWGMSAVNYDLMLQEMLTKTAGKVNQFIYWSRPLDGTTRRSRRIRMRSTSWRSSTPGKGRSWWRCRLPAQAVRSTPISSMPGKCRLRTRGYMGSTRERG